MTVIGTPYPVEIGKIYTARTLTNTRGERCEGLAFKVIKNATREEWIQCVQELEPKEWPLEKLERTAAYYSHQFYWVEMD